MHSVNRWRSCLLAESLLRFLSYLLHLVGISSIQRLLPLNCALASCVVDSTEDYSTSPSVYVFSTTTVSETLQVHVLDSNQLGGLSGRYHFCKSECDYQPEVASSPWHRPRQSLIKRSQRAPLKTRRKQFSFVPLFTPQLQLGQTTSKKKAGK
jgi:hypothetical protein